MGAQSHGNCCNTIDALLPQNPAHLLQQRLHRREARLRIGLTIGTDRGQTILDQISEVAPPREQIEHFAAVGEDRHCITRLDDPIATGLLL